MNLYYLKDIDLAECWADPIEYVTETTPHVATLQTFNDRFPNIENTWMRDFPSNTVRLFKKNYGYYNPAAPYMWFTVTLPFIEKQVLKRGELESSGEDMENWLYAIHNREEIFGAWSQHIIDFQMFFAVDDNDPVYVATRRVLR